MLMVLQLNRTAFCSSYVNLSCDFNGRVFQLKFAVLKYVYQFCAEFKFS